MKYFYMYYKYIFNIFNIVKPRDEYFFSKTIKQEILSI